MIGEQSSINVVRRLYFIFNLHIAECLLQTFVEVVGDWDYVVILDFVQINCE